MQYKTRNIYVLRFGAPYIRDLTVYCIGHHGLSYTVTWQAVPNILRRLTGRNAELGNDFLHVPHAPLYVMVSSIRENNIFMWPPNVLRDIIREVYVARGKFTNTRCIYIYLYLYIYIYITEVCLHFSILEQQHYSNRPMSIPNYGF